MLTAAMLLAALAGWALVLHAGDGMHAMGATMGMSLPAFCVMWLAMMAATMLPMLLPVARLYLRTISRGPGSEARKLRRSGMFVGGYLAGWLAPAPLAFLLLAAVQRATDDAPALVTLLPAAALVVAAAYQLTPLKQRCLHHCRSPVLSVMRLVSLRGLGADARAGGWHAMYCIGCCAGLTLALLALGMMNVWWMAALGLVAGLEKWWRHGERLVRVAAVALVALAVGAQVHSGLASGFGSGPMHMHQEEGERMAPTMHEHHAMPKRRPARPAMPPHSRARHRDPRAPSAGRGSGASPAPRSMAPAAREPERLPVLWARAARAGWPHADATRHTLRCDIASAAWLSRKPAADRHASPTARAASAGTR
ncbi:MAG TPA: DUF2182 domain-containing protein [Conexibacter sp.]|nr:DUF2182 domain-containing protein [Conexibacter sp.]